MLGQEEADVALDADVVLGHLQGQRPGLQAEAACEGGLVAHQPFLGDDLVHHPAIGDDAGLQHTSCRLAVAAVPGVAHH